MWLFSAHEYDHGSQILRWTFLFAAPAIFKEYESAIFSFIHLFTGISILTFSVITAEGLTLLTEKLDEKRWSYYGRLITFAALLVSNIMIATQIFTGYVISKLVMDVFNGHNSIIVFSTFSLALIFFLAVVRSTTCSVKDLR